MTSKQHPIFRMEALRWRRVEPMGSVLLARPISLTIGTAIATAIASLVVTTLILGTYTRKLPVVGQLVPDKGLVKVYPPHVGVVVKKAVAEGQLVEPGDTLFEIADGVRSIHGSMFAAVSEEMDSRRALLKDERTATVTLQDKELLQLERKSNALQRQAADLDRQIETQRAQVGLAGQDLLRHKELVAKGFLTREALTPKEMAELEQQSKLQALLRERTVVMADLADSREGLVSMKLGHRKQLSQLDRQLATENQDFALNEASRRQLIQATERGVVTSLNAEVGQQAEVGRPLLALVPANSTLQAHLYVPSRAIGFVRPGTPVYLRYRTYPYQIFGLAKGAVLSVAKSALPAKDIEPSVASIASSDPLEPVFRVTVALPSQSVSVQGNSHPLVAGMLLDADILVERKRLYQWVLDPLYGGASTL